METPKADNYIERLSNLRDKCYTRIVATKAVEIAKEEFKESIILALQCDNLEELKTKIKELL